MSRSVGARMVREAVVEGGDMLRDFDEPFSHRMEGPHGAVEAHSVRFRIKETDTTRIYSLHPWN